MFDTWTDDQFYAWLAGFFDGEGCIHIPNQPGIDVSISNTSQALIEAIRVRVGLGIIEEITFSKENWRTKYSWRVRRYSEAESLLLRIRPFLTIKAAKADEALAYMRPKLDKVIKRHQLYIEVGELIDSGVPRSEVAERFGMTRKMVDWVYRYRPTLLDRARKGAAPGAMLESVQNHKKCKATVRTESNPKRRRWNLLGEERVSQIRARLSRGEPTVTVAEAFGISIQTVRDIAQRRTWKHVV
ncbi:MAG: hypothetical protein C4551_01930 [Bacillota bacterium]|jgi:transposase|nr:MAG: hypothetical protein C4551_01930 [Bacillota bacterium]